jgi:hypothetical protein
MRSILKYDPMGRVLNEQQFTPASQAAGKAYLPAYTYDLAGNLLTSTDGTTPTPSPTQSFVYTSCPDGVPGTNSSATTAPTLTFANCYDSAGHLQALNSNWYDLSGHPSILFTALPNSSNPSYTAFGALKNATFSVYPFFTALTLNRSYDNRLRIIGETDIGGSSSGSSPMTGASATILITGAEQTK